MTEPITTLGGAILRAFEEARRVRRAPFQTAPTVTREVSDDGLDYTVIVRPHPRDVLPAVLGALARYAHPTAASWQSIAGDPAIVDALTWRLPGAMAEDLAGQLDEDSTEPERCHRGECERFGEVDHATYGWLCLAHAAAADDAQGVDGERSR